MKKLDLFRQAVAEIGDAPAEKLSTFIRHRFGVTIEPRYIPIFRASLQDTGRIHPRPAPPPRDDSRLVGRLTAGDPTSKQKLFDQVRALAQELLAQHGLHGWSFAFNRGKQTMGVCVYDQRRIELSVYFVERNSREEILDTILHEIAHALVGPRHGHDAVWKRQCIAIGARPVRCADALMPEGCWRARCQACGGQFNRHRKPRRVRGWFCCKCGPTNGKLIWKKIPA
jgi:predicted SprT family Zn-dependent metalloprotease